MIQHDKKELVDILATIEKTDDIIDVVTTLENVIKIFVERDFLEREQIDEEILQLVDSLSSSRDISKATLLKIKMLVSDVEKNRARVKDVVTRFNQVGQDTKMRLWLLKENLLTEQQYLKLAEEIDELNVERLVNTIKEFKIGEGLNFLPRKTDQLIDTLQDWLEELVEKGSSALKNKISGVLNELLRRKQITNKRYDEIKQEHSIS